MRNLAGAIIAAIGLAAGAAPAQLVVGNDQPGPTIWLIDLSGAQPARALVTGALANVTSLAADDAGGTLYWVSTSNVMYRAPYATTGALSPVLVGAVSGVPSDLTGLAWDAADHRLIGKANNGLYQINTATGAATLLYPMTAQDFGGLDYDAPTDAFYAANDSALTSSIPGRGVYRISKPLSSPTFTRLAPYPPNDTDIDALAVGGGRVYLVNDSAGQPIFVLNLATGLYETPRTSPLTGPGIAAGATWAPGLLAQAAAADVSAAVVPPAPCSVGPGQTMRFQATIANAGPQPASAATLTITLPPNAAFIGSAPSLAPSQGRLTLVAGSLAAGASASVLVDVTAPASGEVALSAQAAASTPDPVTSNNAASGAGTVRPAPPSSPVASAVVSTLPGAPNSLVPGQGGARFVSLDRLTPSPSGRRWTLVGRADGPASNAGVLVVGDGDSSVLAAREGLLPVLPTIGAGSRVPRTIDPVAAIDDQGRYAFSGEDDRAGTSDDGFVVRSDGAGLWLVAQESYAVPALGPNARFGARRGGVSMQADGSVAFFTSLSGAAVTAATDEALLAMDGGWLIARKGVTTPGGQGGGGASVFAAFDDGAGAGLGFAMAADWSRWVASGALAESAPHDRVAVVDAGVVVQEGWQVWQIPAACTADGAAVEFLGLGPGGSWWSAGSCAQGTAWVVRDHAPVAQSGGEIVPGSGERWASGPGVFFAACANARGDVLLGGGTDAGGRGAGVLVLNSDRVVLRQNDPIDADGNGVFDDAMYLHSVVPWQVSLDENGDVRALVRLRGEAAALCGEADSVAGMALVHLRLSMPCDPDFNADGNADQDDVSYLINVIGGGGNPTGRDPDFNADGNTDQDDVSKLIGVIAGDSCP